MDFDERFNMPLGEAMFSLRAVRRFTDKPISDRDLSSIITAAIQAPNGGNQQLWRFLVIKDKSLILEERIKFQSKLNDLPRDSSRVRIRNRCEITGRPHAVYRKLKISRIALRKLASEGKIPGMVKSSW